MNKKHKVKKLPFNIGNTSIKKLESDRFTKYGDFYVKLESENPTGSIKDRAVYSMLERPY